MIARFHKVNVPPPWKAWATLERDDACREPLCPCEHVEYELGAGPDLPLLADLALILLAIVFLAAIAVAFV